MPIVVSDSIVKQVVLDKQNGRYDGKYNNKFRYIFINIVSQTHRIEEQVYIYPGT